MPVLFQDRHDLLSRVQLRQSRHADSNKRGILKTFPRNLLPFLNKSEGFLKIVET
jgi:hypothetical protein